jgi:hypothetical protein
MMRREPFGLLSRTLRVLGDELTPFLSIMSLRGEIKREQATQNRFSTRVECSCQCSQDVILPGCGPSLSSDVLRTEEGVSRHDRRSGNVVTKDLDVFVIVIRSFVDVADPTTIQEDVREFVNERKNPPVDAILDVDDDSRQRSLSD